MQILAAEEAPILLSEYMAFKLAMRFVVELTNYYSPLVNGLLPIALQARY